MAKCVLVLTGGSIINHRLLHFNNYKTLRGMLCFFLFGERDKCVSLFSAERVTFHLSFIENQFSTNLGEDNPCVIFLAVFFFSPFNLFKRN